MKSKSGLIAFLALFSLFAYAGSTPNIVFTGYPLYAKPITPHDTNPLTEWDGTSAVAQTVYVGGAGDVACVPAGNDSSDIVVFLAIPAGSFVPVMCKLVRSTATTATGLIGLF